MMLFSQKLPAQVLQRAHAPVVAVAEPKDIHPGLPKGW
jgi:hypothetical protein